MIELRKTGWLCAFAVAALIVSAPARVHADISYNFNNGNDDGLTRYDPLATYGSGSTFTFPVVGPGNDAYQLTSGPSADPSLLGPSRVGAVDRGATFTDFRESVDIVGWNASLDQGFGLVARATNIGLGTSDAYYLHYNPQTADVTSGLDIDRIDNESVATSAFTSLNPLDPTVGYRLVFTGVGATLTGQIFALSDLDDPLATVTLTDSTYQSGYSGLLTTGLLGVTNTGVDATFDNFNAQSVPEPPSLVMASFALGGAASILAARGRRAGA